MSTFLDKMAAFDARKGKTQTWDPTTIEGSPVPLPHPSDPVGQSLRSASELYGPPVDQDMSEISVKREPESELPPEGQLEAPRMPQDGLRGVAREEGMSKPDLIVLGHAAEVAGHGVLLTEKEVAQIKVVLIKAVERVMSEQRDLLRKELPKRGRRPKSGGVPKEEAIANIGALLPVKRKRGRPRKVQP